MRKPPLISLSVKVGLVLFAVVAGALAIVYVAVVPQLEDRLVDAKIVELNAAAQSVAGQLSGVNDPITSAEIVSQQAEAFNTRIVVLAPLTDDEMQILFDSRRFQSGEVSADPIALETFRTGVRTSGRIEREGSYAEVGYPLLNNRALLVATPLDDVLANVRLVRRSLLVAGAAALAISWLAGYLLAWNFTRRIRRLETAAERVAEGDFETPVVDRGRDEVGQLADAFDGMRARLAVLDRARQEFIANASHELRTPLFSLGGFVELLGDEDMDAGGAARLPRRDGRPDRPPDAAGDRPARPLAAGCRPAGGGDRALRPRGDCEARRRRVPPDRGGERPRTARGGRRARPRRSATSCARSRSCARSWRTRSGTRLRGRRRSYAWRRATDEVVLEVRDDGPGIPAEDQEHLFQRFYRAAGGKASGSGLGLAIASELALRLDGTIELFSEPGHTVFTLKLPPAGPEPLARRARGGCSKIGGRAERAAVTTMSRT